MTHLVWSPGVGLHFSVSLGTQLIKDSVRADPCQKLDGVFHNSHDLQGLKCKQKNVRAHSLRLVKWNRLYFKHTSIRKKLPERNPESPKR